MEAIIMVAGTNLTANQTLPLTALTQPLVAMVAPLQAMARPLAMARTQAKEAPLQAMARTQATANLPAMEAPLQAMARPLATARAPPAMVRAPTEKDRATGPQQTRRTLTVTARAPKA